MKHLFAIVSAVLFLAGCGKSDDSSSDSSSSSSSDSSGGDQGSEHRDEPKQPVEDYSKPYVTEERMGNFLASLKEHQNPFEIMAKGGVVAGLTGSRLEETNAFARKYKFKDAAEYIGAWARVFATWMAVKMEETAVLQAEGYDIQIKTMETELKKPDLAPEVRTAYENQLKQIKDAQAEAKKPKESQVPKEDLAVMKKHAKEYEALLNEKKK
jgi:hypothetical protein